MKSISFLPIILLLCACGEAPKLRSLSEIENERKENAKDDDWDDLGETDPSSPNLIVRKPAPQPRQTTSQRPQTPVLQETPEEKAARIKLEQQAWIAQQQRAGRTAMEQRAQQQNSQYRSQRGSQLQSQSNTQRTSRQSSSGLSDAEQTIRSRERGAISAVASTRDTYSPNYTSSRYAIKRYRGQYFCETPRGTIWLKKKSGEYFPQSNPFR